MMELQRPSTLDSLLGYEVLVKTDNGNVNGKFLSWELNGDVLLLSICHDKLVVKNWFAITSKDIIGNLKQRYVAPDHDSRSFIRVRYPLQTMTRAEWKQSRKRRHRRP